MQVEAKVFTRIAILNLTETVTKDDMASLDLEMVKLASKIPAFIVVIDAAKFDKPAVVALTKIRDKFSSSKSRLFIVSTKFDQADALDIIGALDLIGNADSDKITAYFTREKKLKDLTARFNETALEATKHMRSALGLPDDGKPLDPQAFSQALIKFKDFNKQLETTYKTLGTEIANLKKQRLKAAGSETADADAQDKLDEVKRKALIVMKNEGLL